MRQFVSLLLVILWLGGTAHAAESQAITSERDEATLVTDRDAIGPDQILHVGLRLKLKPGWHTYWVNPGDAGEAPVLKVQASGGAEGASDTIDWPTPVRLSEGGLMAYAYEGDVVLPEVLKLRGKSLQGKGGVTLKAHAEWLVCENTCVPEEGEFTLVLPPADADPGPGAQAPLFAKAEAARPVPSPFAASFGADGILTLSGAGLSAQSVHDAWFMPSAGGLIDHVAKQALSVGDGHVSLKLTWAAGSKAPSTVAGIVVLQDAAGKTSSLWIDAKNSGATPSAATLSAPVAAHPADASYGLGMLLVFAFLGGLILNLMPCVFPVLAMKALSVAKMGAHGRRAAFHSAFAYTGGVMGTFALLGLLLFGLRAAGSVAGWGFQFQSSVFVVGVGWLLFLMALNLLGVFEITTGLGQDVRPKTGLAGDVMTGTLAVVVATPCTAPFMGVAIAAALGGGAVSSLAIFLSMGLGLAFPYLLIAGVPGIATRLPKPGNWMSILRQFLAFPLLATCVWLLWVAGLQRGPDVVGLATGGAVALGFAAWMYGLAQQRAMTEGVTRGVIVVRAIAIGVFALVVASLARIDAAPAPHVSTAAMEQSATSRSVPYSAEALAKARAQGRPVFIDMTAAWCITCMVNERVALYTADVQDAFHAHDIVYMKGDWTNRDQAITDYLRAHGRDGVPLYVYYPSHGPEQVLPQILTPGMVLSTING